MKYILFNEFKKKGILKRLLHLMKNLWSLWKKSIKKL